MPYKDPEKRREYNREWQRANPERVRAAFQRWYETHKDARNAQSREWQRANRDRDYQNHRRRWEAGHRPPPLRRRDAALAELWHEQGGACYLCGDPLQLKDAHLEHDHRCCQNEFCSFCVRGAAHPQCNWVVGYANDDPDRLELIARNLRAKLAEVDVRLASKPQQLSLGDAG